MKALKNEAIGCPLPAAPDSQHPLYKKGFQAGRRRTEAEVARMEDARRDQWNACFMALLPTALTVQNWTMGDKKVTSSEDRIELARRWTDRAMTILQ